jgi:replication factor C large subunit
MSRWDGDEPLVEAYRPTTLKELQGNNSALTEIKAWLRDFEQGDTPILLHGRPGVGKSSSIQALANDMDYELIEVNASDSRKSADIAELAEEAGTASSFSGEDKIIMFDEVDSLSGRSNFGPLLDVMDDAPCPLVFICNDEYEVPQSFKNRCETYKFSLGERSVKAKLKEIVKNEDFDIGMSTISVLAKRDNLRDAIQDLQRIVEGGQHVSEIESRSYEKSIFDAIDDVIQGEQTGFEDNPEKVIEWVDQNLRGKYRLIELHAAHEALSRSDKWLGRVKDGDYSWWKYAGALQEHVPNLRLSDPYDGFIKTEKPDSYDRWGPSSDLQEVYEKLSGYEDKSFEMGASRYEFRHQVLPILKDLDKKKRRKLALRYGIEGSALEVLNLDPDTFEDWKEGRLDSIGSKPSFGDEDEEEEDGGFLDW